MALEASEVAVRVRLLGGAAFEREASGVAASVERIGRAGKVAEAGLIPSMNRAHTAITKVGSSMSRTGAGMMNTGRALVQVSIPVAALGYYAVKSSVQFEQSMTLLRTQALDSALDVRYLTAQVLALSGKSLAQSPNELAKGLYNLVSVGMRGSQAIGALKVAGQAASMGMDTLQNTTSALAGAWRTGLPDVKNFKDAMVIMDTTVGLGKMHLQDLTEAMKSGALQEFKVAGLGLRDYGDAIAAMTRQGIPANIESNRLRLTITKMIAPVGAGKKALADLGLSSTQLHDDLHKPQGLITALSDLKGHMDALHDPHRALTDLSQAFGQSRGLVNIAGLLNVLPQMKSMMTGTPGHPGFNQATATQFDKRTAVNRQTEAYKLQLAHAALDKSMVILGHTLELYVVPILTKLVGHISDAVTWFGQLPGPVKKFAVWLGLALVVGGPLLLFFGGLVRALGGVITAVGMVGRIFTGLVGGGGKLATLIDGGLMGSMRTMESDVGRTHPLWGTLIGDVEGTRGPLGRFGSGVSGAAGYVGRFAGAVAGTLGPLAAFAVAIPSIVTGLQSMVQNIQDPNKRVQNNLNNNTGVSPSGGPGTGLGSTPTLMGPNNGGKGTSILGVHVGGPAGSLLKSVGGLFSGLAEGGQVLHGGMTLIGEQGPELLTLPTGAMVNPLPAVGGSGVMPGAGGGNMSAFSPVINLHSVVQIDQRILGEVMTQYNRDKHNRR